MDDQDHSPEDLTEASRYSLLIQWSDEGGAFVVSVPELPGLHTHGATPADMVRNGEEGVAVWLAGLRDDGLPVPAPRGFVVMHHGS